MRSSRFLITQCLRFCGQHLRPFLVFTRSFFFDQDPLVARNLSRHHSDFFFFQFIPPTLFSLSTLFLLHSTSFILREICHLTFLHYFHSLVLFTLFAFLLSSSVLTKLTFSRLHDTLSFSSANVTFPEVYHLLLPVPCVLPLNYHFLHLLYSSFSIKVYHMNAILSLSSSCFSYVLLLSASSSQLYLPVYFLPNSRPVFHVK